jgi:quinol monooxygenase YgiN
MPRIEATTNVFTLINTFTVSPEDHDALMKILEEATKSVMSQRPGFISASLHTSPNKTRIANYAQWRSEDDFRAAITHPSFRPHFDACREISEADPQLYRVHYTEEAH